MEPLFEIRNAAEPRSLAEYFGRFTRVVNYAVYVLIGLALAYVLVTGNLHEIPNVLFTGMVVAVAAHSAPYLIVWYAMRAQKKQFGGVIPETIITVGDAIRIRQNTIDLTVNYDKITEVKHLKYSYLLIAGKSTVILLNPNDFTKGTFQEFKQFLREKRPDLTIPE